MLTRRLGRIGHNSSVGIFGAAAIGKSTQAEADKAMEQVIGAGVNHIDVAPSYGIAEKLLAPWMVRERNRFFLACKTTQRDKKRAASELRGSLETLGVTHFDLYQLHAVNSFEELDQVTAPSGALKAIIDAKEAGLTRFIGITSHGNETPGILLEALRRFDFDTVLFPLNFIQFANPIYRMYTESLLIQCRDKDIGTITIKAIAQGPWNDEERKYRTWYKPFDEQQKINDAVNFVLSQNVTGICTPGDPTLLPMVLQACQNFTPMDLEQQTELIRSAEDYQSVF
jgi:aryl-alcohol dehydrogenase-like predicted oxidoreductase